MSVPTALFCTMMKEHVWMHRASGGRIGSKNGSLFLVATTGRKSGKEHTILLMGSEYGSGFLVAASAGGSSNHPARYVDLRGNPSVTGQRGESSIP